MVDNEHNGSSGPKQVNIAYSYQSVPTIFRFAECPAFIRGIMGPFGSGKSSGCVIEIVRRAMLQEPGPDGIRRTRWVIVRNSYPQLKDTTIRTFHDWLPPKHFGKWNKTEHDYLITAFEGVEIEVMFRALDRPEHVANLLSMEVTGAWLNEAREIPKAIFEAVQGRVGRYPSKREGGATWQGVIMDTNPPDTESWWFKYFEETMPHNAEVFKQPSGRSPHAENLVNLPINYYDNLAAGKSPEFVKVYVDGEYGFVQDGKPVYGNYSDSIHCAKHPLVAVKGVPFLLGWDFGLTPACVVCQLTLKGQLNIIKEFVSNDMGIRRFATEVVKPSLLTEFHGFPINSFGDPAGSVRGQTDERTCMMELRDAGIRTEEARTNSLVARIGAVDYFLSRTVDGSPALQLSPECVVLRKGFNGGYRYRRLQLSGDDRYTESPEKNFFSHPHDALQCVAMEVDRAIEGTRRLGRYEGGGGRRQARPKTGAFS